MHAKWLILIAFLFLFSTQVAAFIPVGDATTDGQLAELTELGLTGSEIAFAPGSSIYIYDPIDSSGNRLVWVSNVEPTSATWKIFNPNLQKLGEHTHTPSFKKQGNYEVNGQTFKWAFADQWEFTVPAFASKGNWLLSPSYRMADGTTHSGAYTYYAVPVTKDDAFASIFSAPWYLLGIKMPAYFWFPGIIIWFPLFFYGFSLVFPRGMEYMVISAKNIREGIPRRKK